jgi:hypothetical protein
MRIFRTMLVVASATALLAVSVSAAAARSFSTSSQTFRMTFRRITFNGVFGDIRCQLTMEGSLHGRTIAKTSSELVGFITASSFGPCESGLATLLIGTLPWHLRYQAFTGTLPNITSTRLRLVGMDFLVREPFVGCRVSTTPTEYAIVTLNREVGSGALATAELEGSISTTCGVLGTLSSDRGPVVILSSTTRITLTLI